MAVVNTMDWLQTALLVKNQDLIECYLVALRNELCIGRLLHVRRITELGGSIRYCLSKWERRVAKEYGYPSVKYKVWGNHDGMIVPARNKYGIGIGEALWRGNSVTAWSTYERDIRKGYCQVRLYEVIDTTENEQRCAVDNWYRYVRGTPYNYMGYPRLLIKSLLMDFADIECRGPVSCCMQRFGDSICGWRWANWCTEGYGRAYAAEPLANDIFQTANATPLTVEQCAGELPRKPGKKITLRQIKITV